MYNEEIHKLYTHFIAGEGVFTDSRNPVQGGVFFALSGPNFNGNQFAENALAEGASIAVIDDQKYQKDDRFFLVDDALQALQSLANYHRSQFSGPVLAITGSNGKTTTKELISRVLANKYELIATEGNLNNHIGVPLTLLRITEKTDFAVIEMGANHIGEIKLLCEIANPTHGLITNIGRAHIEGFGSVEGIKKGKGELYEFLKENEGIAFVNSTDRTLVEMSFDLSNILTYPNRGDYSQTELLAAKPYVHFKSESGTNVETHLIGKYNFMNVATALCIGKYFEVPTTAVEELISSYVPEINRSQIIKRGTNTIILDAYNANPDSMSAALQTISEMEADCKMVILGDMLELGDKELEEHLRLGEKVEELSLHLAVFCGELVKHSAKKVSGALYFPTKNELVDYLRGNQISNATILIKASRGIGLETIVEGIL